MSSTKTVARVLAVCFGVTATIHLKAGYNGAVLFWSSQDINKADEIPQGIEYVLISVRGTPEGRATWFRNQVAKRPVQTFIEELDSVADLELRLEEIFNGSSIATVTAMSTSAAELFKKVGLIQSRVDGLIQTIQTALEVIGNELTEIRNVAETVHAEQSATALRLQTFEHDLQLANDMKELLARHSKIS